MWLFIEPCDVLLFRDSRPFNMGEAQPAFGEFPPTGPTIMGALRSTILTQALGARGRTFRDYHRQHSSLEDVVEAVGPPGTEGYGRLRLYGPWLARSASGYGPPREVTWYALCPLDLLTDEEQEVEAERALEAGTSPALNSVAPLDREPPGSAGAPFPRPLWVLRERGMSAEGLADRYMPVGDLRTYLARTGKPRLFAGKTFYTTERRMGLALDASKRTSRPGHLYSVDFVRLLQNSEHRHGLLCYIEGLDQLPEDARLPEQWTQPLGGERHMAVFSQLNAPDELAQDGPSGLGGVLDAARDQVQQTLEQKQRDGGPLGFRLYLSTPAVFNNGFLPDFVGPPVKGDRQQNGYTMWRCRWNGLSFDLVGAAVGKPRHIGGWDLARQEPKPLRRAVPTASVYFCQLTTGTVQELVDTFWCKSIVYGPDGAAGLGLTFLGVW